jgi:uncharacterized metal-binding protein YceD (DUF177 family)
VKELRPYTIDIYKLENKRHEYTLLGDDAFFAALEQDLIQKGRFEARVTLEKSETMLQWTFHIKGAYELLCDRSLEPFEEPFETTQKLILKFGDRAEVLTDEIELIPWSTQTVNLAPYLFDYIGLTIPMKKLHPRFRTEPGDETEEGTLVYSSEGTPEAEAPSTTPDVDPRWAALQKLKNREN